MNFNDHEYVCTFVGQRKGAIGITYAITEIVKCELNRVIPQLYNKYQNIFNLTITDTTSSELVDVEYAIDVAKWLPGE